MDYKPELERLRSNLKAVVETFARHRRITTGSALNRIAKASHATGIWADSDIKAGSYDKWMRAFSDAWPDDDGLEWPQNVPRPPKSEPLKAAS